MEIDITAFFENADPFEFSHSRAEGGANAGPQTWANAKEEAQYLQGRQRQNLLFTLTLKETPNALPA